MFAKFFNKTKILDDQLKKAERLGYFYQNLDYDKEENLKVPIKIDYSEREKYFLDHHSFLREMNIDITDILDVVHEPY